MFGKTQTEHDENLIQVLERLKENNFKINEEKSQYNKSEVNFLGHVISIKEFRQKMRKSKQSNPSRSLEIYQKCGAFLDCQTKLDIEARRDV